MSVKFLIVGLGNPGVEFEGTRHNLGFTFLRQFAQKHHLQFKKKSKWDALVSDFRFGEDTVFCLMPQTFMNRSGRSIVAALRDLQIDLAHLLIVVDDIDLPLGRMKIKLNTSAGGHNGLKSIEYELQTNRFARLKLGVGDRQEGDLSSHVLERFLDSEIDQVSQMLQRALQAVEIWLNKGITSAMDFANRHPSNPSNGV
jgi:PTH1 family peptidyl-tRNA hydrolase